MQLDGNAAPRAATAHIGAVDPAAEYSVYRAQNAEAAGQSGSIGFKGSSLAYRKIGEAHAGLEVDDLFGAFQRKPIFKDACERAYGKHAAISIYRSMVRSARPDVAAPWVRESAGGCALRQARGGRLGSDLPATTCPSFARRAGHGETRK